MSSPLGVLGLMRWGWHLEKGWEWLGVLIFCTPYRAAHPERLLAEASRDCAEAVLLMLPRADWHRVCEQSGA